MRYLSASMQFIDLFFIFWYYALLNQPTDYDLSELISETFLLISHQVAVGRLFVYSDKKN